MTIRNLIFFFLVCFSLSCKQETKSQTTKTTESETLNENKPEFEYDSLYIARSFDFPVGKPDAEGYYNAQKFQENMH